ncbi:amidohydrolase family protein [Streptomyces sp. NPDC007162]|uniref:amidohydrolase family protein n=1 Tax=Streptomyces sp. NPDC007162 TaxID=3156917 RepID=UPI003410F10C
MNAVSAAPQGARILITGGTVLTMDPELGDFAVGDVLIEDGKIAAVGENLGDRAAGAEVVDVKGMILLPGFVNSHMHMYHTLGRALIADGGFDAYVDTITIGPDSLDAAHRPEDVQLAVLVAALQQINAGVTTTIDTSHYQPTPAHRDGIIAGLRESGLRAVFTYWGGMVGEWSDWDDLARVRAEYFDSDDQLLTLALGGNPDVAVWRAGREHGLNVIAHARSEAGAEAIARGHEEGILGPHMTFIHCTDFDDISFKYIADSGGAVSIAAPIELSMGQGLPPFQQSLDHGILPSLSSDVETNMASDMFTVMRSAFTSQRHEIHTRALAGDSEVPALLTSAQLLRSATSAGAAAAHLDSIGSLTPGKRADVVVLDARSINTMPLNSAVQAVVALMDTSNVEHVLVDGVPRKWAGRLVGVDVGKLAREVETARDGLFARSGKQVPLV